MATNPSSGTFFPLRWESTGDKWWYASPIDCAAANGHYDLVRQLIRLDPNHLISLTSLRRLRRLESVWDDAGVSRFSGAAKSRSDVARRLLLESDLIGSGYGGWILYTAASAGDVDFVREILDRNPLLVFGEGEYGLTDILYAAARSRSSEVFWILYEFAASPRFERAEKSGGRGAAEVPSGFKWEVVNRAVHAAARGGSLAVLAELLGGGSGGGVLSYRDAYGSTVLHAAAGRGQVEVVKHLITAYDDIISSTDNQGNTALHVAAYKGQLSVVEALLISSPSSISATNKAGDTLLHMAVAGSLSPGCRRVDRQIELVKQLITTRNSYKLEDIINSKNVEGRTALHMAIIGNVHSDLVQHLMAARYINVNIRDDHGLTPLDYLRQQPRSSSSEMLIRQLILAGGMSNCQDYSTRKAIASHLRMQGAVCSSPGTTFRVLDSEIFNHSGIEHVFSGSSVNPRVVKIRHNPSLSEISQCGSNGGEEEQVCVENKKRGGTVQNAAKRLKTMFRWPKTHKKKSMDGDRDHVEAPIPLRERFSGPTSLSNNKRTLSVRSNISSPTNRKKLASGVVQGFMMDLPHAKNRRQRSSSSSLSKISISSNSSLDKGKASEDAAGSSLSAQDEADETPRLMHKQGSVNKKLLVNQYLCFGGSGLSVKNPMGKHQRHPSHGKPIQTVACH